MENRAHPRIEINQLITFAPLTEATWPHLEQLFGERGACGGCWCMTWRLRQKEYEAQKGNGNKKAFHELVLQNKPAGVLAFCNGAAIGWCAVAPREDCQRLETSRVLKPVDGQPVWSIVCFFIRKDFRGKGLSLLLIKAAVEYAVACGATVVEAYPVAPKKKTADVFAFTGLASAFAKAGFREVVRRSATRPVMRWYVHERRTG